MMEEWKEYKLGEVVNILDSKRVPLSSKERSTRQGCYPYYGAQGIIDYIDDYLFDGTYLLIAEDGENLKSQKQNVAQLASGKYWVNNHAHILESNGESDIRYICYLLNTLDLSGYITGSAQPKLNQANLVKISIKLPPLELQKYIADYLSVIDDKIEVNRKINENLEQQAQALFKSWFVDFEPFKDGEFVESELGRIPKGWRVGALGDICVTNKRSYKGDFAHEIEYIDTGSVTNNVIESTQFLNPATDKIPSRARRAVTEGDIIYSSVRPNQRHFALLFNPASNTVVSTGFVVITANWSGYRYYIYQYLIQDEIVDKLQAIAEQSVSTFPSLNAADITNLKIVIPPNDIVGDFAAICCSFIQQIEKNQQESRRLATLRDTLLPKLMSGELKVGEIKE